MGGTFGGGPGGSSAGGGPGGGGNGAASGGNGVGDGSPPKVTPGFSGGHADASARGPQLTGAGGSDRPLRSGGNGGTAGGDARTVVELRTRGQYLRFAGRQPRRQAGPTGPAAGTARRLCGWPTGTRAHSRRARRRPLPRPPAARPAAAAGRMGADSRPAARQETDDKHR